MNDVIDLKGVSYRYGSVQALHDVDLKVGSGSLCALLGPNGSGKTTLLKILIGMLRPQHGRAAVFGKPVTELTPADRAQITYIAEGLQLPGWMRLQQLENYLAPLYNTWDYALADELRERFGLNADRKIKTLSRGEHMKAALLCALAPRPRLLLMDEPFTGMDVIAKDEIVRGLLEATTSSSWTILISSHDLAELEALADSVAFLHRGRMTFAASTEELYRRFHRIDVTTTSPVHDHDIPSEWRSVEQLGTRMTFVMDTIEDTPADAVRAVLPGALTIEARPATLREVFVAVSTHAGDSRVGTGV